MTLDDLIQEIELLIGDKLSDGERQVLYNLVRLYGDFCYEDGEDAGIAQMMEEDNT
jgi:hypothetical protein